MRRDRDRASMRESFRPADVKILFIGESPPAGGALFYAANSNLFRYTNAAFQVVARYPAEGIRRFADDIG